jgi:cobalt-zinc-cadmium efflux system outer membrane protein
VGWGNPMLHPPKPRSKVGLQARATSAHGVLIACVCAASAGCASSSIRSDVGRVHELTRAPALPAVIDRRVDPKRDPAVQRALQEPLDADAAVRVALLANRELRARLRELGVARGQLLQAGLLPNPRAEVELLPERGSELELRVEFDITRALLAPLRARGFDAELEATRYAVAAAVVDLAYRVRVGYVRVQATEQRLGIARQALAALDAARLAARALFEAGNLPALDLATHEAAHDRATVEAERIELDVATERERFTRVLGLADARPTWRVRSLLPVAPEQPMAADDLESRALRANLELQGARQHLVSLARRAGFARTEGLVPDVAVDVHALTGRPESQAGNSADWRFGGGISLSLPLFDRQQGTALALDAAWRAGLERYYGLAADLRSETRELQQRLQSAHTRARKYQEVILPGQSRVTEQSLLQYNAMQLGVFQLLAARREQLDAQLAYVDTLREYWSAVIEVEALLQGRRSSSSVPAASELTTTAASPAEHG